MDQNAAEQIKTKIESEAEKMVKAMIDEGFSFNSIEVDKLKF